MSFSLSGTILEISEVQQIKETFKKREFVVEYSDNPQYPEYIKFELIQDKCALLDAYKVGDKVQVQFNLKGRKWTDSQGQIKYFNSLQAWRIEVESSQSTQSIPEAAPLDNLAEPDWGGEDKEDDLPF